MISLKKTLLTFTALVCGAPESWAMFESDGADRKDRVTTQSTTQRVRITTEVYNALNPLEYISQFTLLPEEASKLLFPLWKTRGSQAPLSAKIGVSKPTLKDLIEENKENKALREFNKNLIEKEEVWNLFKPEQHAQIIISQLIQITSQEGG